MKKLKTRKEIQQKGHNQNTLINVATSSSSDNVTVTTLKKCVDYD